MKRSLPENDTNWKLCFLCQQKTRDKLRSTPEGITRLSTNIIEFYKIDALKFDISRIATFSEYNVPQIEANLKAHSAQYHHNCAARYNQREFEATKAKQKRVETNQIDTEPSISTKSRRNSVTLNTLGSFQCCICGNEDVGKNNNLHAAGAYHACNKKTDAKHVAAFTKKLYDIALALDNEFLLNKLALGDVASNEMFYHGSCLKSIESDYKKHLKTKLSSVNDDWVKTFALNKVISYVYDTEQEIPGTIFLVKELEKRYIAELKQRNIEVTSHVTRFSEKLTSSIEGLVSKTDDKVTTVCFSQTLDSIYWEHYNNSDSFVKQLRAVVAPIRKDLLEKVNNFDSSFNEDSQLTSIPIRLLTLVNFLIDGTCEGDVSQVALTCSQIIMYNCKEKKTGYHLKKRETPAVIYTSLKIYSTVRSKTLIDYFFSIGICIPYKRVLQITKYLYEKLRLSFNLNDAFLPGVLRKGLFTILAKDNIDKNAKSTFAKSHYHGTSISILQFATSTNQGTELPSIVTPKILSASTRLAPLPKEYSSAKPLPYNPGQSDLFAPVSEVNFDTLSASPNLERSITEEIEWLDTFHPISVDTSCYPTGWAQHHATYKRCGDCTPGINAIMPLLRDPVHTLNMQYHCMSINQKTIDAVNPGQTPVDVSDQPVYALTKEVQLRFSKEFKNYFPMMGDLHTEKMFLVCHSQLIHGSGLHEVLKVNKFSLLGTSSIVDVNDIKRARYCLQVALCALYCKMCDAHRNSGSTSSPMEWLASKAEESEMCLYWQLVIKMQMNILIFVRSIREGNFKVYVESIQSLIKWTFSLDHHNYARWLTIYLFDLMTLEKCHPNIHKEMVQGKFSFQKTYTEFSRIGIDQVHEQNNKVIKGYGGASELLNKEDESALIRWETCGPDIARIVSEFEELICEDDNTNVLYNDKPKPRKHHEDTPTFRENFTKDVQNLYEKITCNPFEISKLTMINNTSTTFCKEVIDQIEKLEEVGDAQYQTFVIDRLINAKVSINAKIRKNNFKIMNTDLKTKSVPTSASNTTLMNKLRSAAAYRPEQISKLFEGEIFGVAQSLAEDKKSLYHGTKSEIKKRFKQCSPPDINTNTSAIIIELSPIVFKHAERVVDSFNDFSVLIYYDIMNISSNFRRIDVVCDRYFQDSLKEQTRKMRGVGTSFEFNGDTSIPVNFRDDFLHNSQNKNKLNEYLAKQMVALHTGSKELRVTYKDSIISNMEGSSNVAIASCTSEEADQRLVRHTKDALNDGYKTVVIRTIDTDVLILLISYISESCYPSDRQVFAAMGKSNESLQFYNIRCIAAELQNKTQKALPFFYAFTGCDTVSSIFNKGKCKVWDAWLSDERCTDITSVFIDLGNLPESIHNYQIDILEYFLIKLYSPGTKKRSDSLAQERFMKFECSPDNDLRKLPMSRPGLIEHAKRSSYQAGYLWRECDDNIDLPDATLWGYVRDEEDLLVPKWQEMQTVEIPPLIETCTCQTRLCKSCKCSKGNRPCLPFCLCRRCCDRK